MKCWQGRYDSFCLLLATIKKTILEKSPIISEWQSFLIYMNRDLNNGLIL